MDDNETKLRELSILKHALPKTSDGQTVHPGMTVYYMNYSNLVLKNKVSSIYKNRFAIATGYDSLQFDFFSSIYELKKAEVDKLEEIFEKAPQEGKS